MKSTEPLPATTFAELGLKPEVLKALSDVGYENPTPIQAETIPALLAGADLLGQAQTGCSISSSATRRCW
jgi:ATP-dependent RNA helicase DeaD